LFEEKLGRKAIRWWVKELRYRRGSCTKDDKIYFHRKIALAPTDVIDYIIAHELVHIIEKKHTKRFWDLLSLVFPWHEKQKRWLAENGGDLVL
jgi:predicted metal-dependent hydrolase